jgi:hypothetical protein
MRMPRSPAAPTTNDTLHTSGVVGSTRERKLIEPGSPKNRRHGSGLPAVPDAGGPRLVAGLHDDQPETEQRAAERAEPAVEVGHLEATTSRPLAWWRRNGLARPDGPSAFESFAVFGRLLVGALAVPVAKSHPDELVPAGRRRESASVG